MNRPKIPSFDNYTNLSPQTTYALLAQFDEYLRKIEKDLEDIQFINENKGGIQ